MGFTKGGVKNGLHHVSDFVRHDASRRSRPASSRRREIVARCAWRSPIGFLGYVQKAKDLARRHLCLHPGRRAARRARQGVRRTGLDAKKTVIMGQLEITDEHALGAWAMPLASSLRPLRLEPQVEDERGFREGL